MLRLLCFAAALIVISSVSCGEGAVSEQDYSTRVKRAVQLLTFGDPTVTGIVAKETWSSSELMHRENATAASAAAASLRDIDPPVGWKNEHLELIRALDELSEYQNQLADAFATGESLPDRLLDLRPIERFVLACAELQSRLQERQPDLSLLGC